jgi:hypothetical protein
MLQGKKPKVGKTAYVFTRGINPKDPAGLVESIIPVYI